MSVLTDTHWPGTLQLNAVRVVAATVTLVCLYLLGRVTGLIAGNSWAQVSVLNVLVIPFGLMTVGLLAILMLRGLGKVGIPYMDSVAGLMALMMIVFIAVGDPLVWLVRKYYPALVPVDDFSFINPRAVIMVQRAPVI